MSARVNQTALEWLIKDGPHDTLQHDAALDLQDLRAALRDVQRCVNDSSRQHFALVKLIALLPEEEI